MTTPENVADSQMWTAIGYLDHLDQFFKDDVVATFAMPLRRELTLDGNPPDGSMMERFLRLASARKPEGASVLVPGHEDILAYAGSKSPVELAEVTLPELQFREQAIGLGIEEHQVTLLGAAGWEPLAAWIAIVLGSRTPTRMVPDDDIVQEIFDNQRATSLYIRFISRVSSGLIAYADKRWHTHKHASLDDAFSEDLFKPGEPKPPKRKLGEAPSWYEKLRSICDDAISWIDDALSEREPFVDTEDTNSEYLACVGARQVHRMWPTVSEARALRWIVEGGKLNVPDLTVEEGDDGSVVIHSLGPYVLSENDEHNASVWRQVIEHRGSREAYGITTQMTYTDVRRRWPMEAKSTIGSMTYLSYLFCELVVSDLRHWYPEESRASRERRTVVPESSTSKAEYRPEPHRGWEGCLKGCMLVGLRNKLAGKRDEIDFDKCGHEWAAMAGYLENRRRIAKKHLERDREKLVLLPVLRHLHVDKTGWPFSDDVKTADTDDEGEAKTDDSKSAKGNDAKNRFVEPWSVGFNDL